MINAYHTREEQRDAEIFLARELGGWETQKRRSRRYRERRNREKNAERERENYSENFAYRNYLGAYVSGLERYNMPTRVCTEKEEEEKIRERREQEKRMSEMQEENISEQEKGRRIFLWHQREKEREALAREQKQNSLAREQKEETRARE